MNSKITFLGVAVLLGVVFLFNNTSGVVYDVCEAMSDEEVSYDDFQALIEAIYNGDCNEAMNVKTTFSMSHDDFSELAYTYEIVDTEGNPLVFYRTGAPSPIGAGAILVYGNDGDFPVKMGDYIQIWTSGSPKDIIIEVGMEGCDPYDGVCDAMCSYEEEYVCDPLCYVHDEREDVQCDIDCVDVNGNHIVDAGDIDGICDLDCYNDDLDPKRAYDPDCVDVDNLDDICDPDSQGVVDGRCDPDCAPANHHCDFDCNATTYPGNPNGLNDTDCYECDGICNGFCSFDCTYLDHDPDCPAGFTDWFDLTECCGNSKCGIGENCETCKADCPPEGNCSDFGVDFFCCPDAVNADMSGCAELTTGKLEGENCTCAPECSDAPDKLLCTGPTGDKHCCPAGEVWNGSECKLGGDVLIVALKANLESVYSAGQITSLEDKINDFIDALAVDGLGGSFFYLDDYMTSDVTPGGVKVNNPSDPDDIDSVLNVLIPKMKSKYLIIIGGYERFPKVIMTASNIPTDDDYGDYVSPEDGIPDVAIGRIPDPNGGDIRVLLNTLDTSIDLHRTTGLDISDYIWIIMKYYSGCNPATGTVPVDGSDTFEHIIGKSCTIGNGCYNNNGGRTSLSAASGKGFFYSLAHGYCAGLPQYYDDGCSAGLYVTPGRVSAIDVSDAVWVTCACCGGRMRGISSTDQSIVMAFFKKGGAVFIGGELVQFVNAIGPYYEKIFMSASVGDRIGDVFMNSKTGPTGGGHSDYTKYNTVLYGDPSLKIESMW